MTEVDLGASWPFFDGASWPYQNCYLAMGEGLENKIFKSSVLDIKCSLTVSLTKPRDINKPRCCVYFSSWRGDWMKKKLNRLYSLYFRKQLCFQRIHFPDFLFLGSENVLNKF